MLTIAARLKEKMTGIDGGEKKAKDGRILKSLKGENFACF